MAWPISTAWQGKLKHRVNRRRWRRGRNHEMTDPVNFAAMNRRTLLGTAAAAAAATVALPLASGQVLA
jgi:secreted PhoX family phosphatase